MKFKQYNPSLLILFFIVYAYIIEKIISFVIYNTNFLVSVPTVLLLGASLYYLAIAGFNYIEKIDEEVILRNFVKKYRVPLSEIDIKEEKNNFTITIKGNKKIRYNKISFGLFTKGGDAVNKFKEIFSSRIK